jgi:hypothetical protein
MLHVTLTDDELMRFYFSNPLIPLEYCSGLLLERKGIKFKPTFHAYTESDMITPWKIWRNRDTKVLHVTQGEEARITPVPIPANPEPIPCFTYEEEIQ